jgi:membrane-associated PAP2 superfamily phosphatase
MPAASRPLTRWHWILPGAVLAAGTLAVWLGDWDLRVARQFYVPSDPTHWPVGYHQPWAFLYRWAVIPAIGLAAAGLLLLARSSARGRRDAQARSWRQAGLIVVLSLALGPLLLVNGVLHETWGRPRPRQVLEFGGNRPFRPPLLPTWDRQAQSFPTGHAVGGYAVLVLYFVWRERRARLAWFSLATGLALGGVTSWARIAQGGHWLSDGIWSAGIVWFSGWAIARMLEWRDAKAATSPRAPPFHAPPAPVASAHASSPAQTRLTWAAAAYGAAALALCAGYLASLPLLERMDRELPVPVGVNQVQVEWSGPAGSIHHLAAAGSAVRLTTTLSGRGAPWVGLADGWEPQAGPAGELRGRYTVAVRGYRASQNLELWVATPAGVQVTVRRTPPG